ncbi:hypothetical protein SRABI106_03666 [Rahnella aquatilis]|nr:hypothetical protein SRABI106_03666 [Rahnella aquatilis]
MKTCADGNAVNHIANHARQVARSNNGIDARPARDICRLQFGGHAAGTETGDAVARHTAQFIINGHDFADQFSFRIGPRICGKQTTLIGQQQQFIGTRQNSGQCGKIVVIADFNFSGGDRIVFINDRHDMVIEQRVHGVAGIQEPLAVFHVGTRQQHLTNVDAINREQLLPQLDQTTLPDGSQQLFGSNGGGEFGVAKMFTPGSNRARRDNHNPVPCRMLLRALADKLNNVSTVEAARAASEHAGAQFYNQCLTTTHNRSISVKKKGFFVFVTAEKRYAKRHNAIIAAFMMGMGSTESQAESFTGSSLKSSAGSSLRDISSIMAFRFLWNPFNVVSSFSRTSASLMFCTFQMPSLSNNPK